MSSEIRHVTTNIQGRYLVDRPSEDPTLCIIGFHGYRSNAEQLMANLLELRQDQPWLLCSVQALSRFYSRSGEVIASWMTKQDREAAIMHNIEYVNRILADDCFKKLPLVYVGFSQGAAMSFRAAAKSTAPASLQIAVGGDVPPDIAANANASLPRTLLCRGTNDSLYPEEQFQTDQTTLQNLACDFSTIEYSGAHEWNESLYSQLRVEIGHVTR